MASFVSNYTGQKIESSFAFGSAGGIAAGDYPSISALTAAKPSGENNIYVTTDNGCWNYWNGTTWVQGARYYPQASNKDLLDNPDFRVNQRGQPSYSGSYVSAIDRWKINDVTYNVANRTITPAASGSGGAKLFQLIEKGRIEPAKVHTFSVFVDNSLYSVTGIPINGVSTATPFGELRMGVDGNSYVFCQIAVTYGRNAVTITSAKLELGSVSTLANDPPADYGEQLEKCQRYFVRFNYPQYACISIASSDTGYIMYSLSLATALRIGNPTLSITCSPTRSSDALTLADVTINTTSAGMVTLGKLYSGAAQSSTIFAASAGHIDLSADL